MRPRRLGFSRFWFGALLAAGAFTSATVPALAAVILAAAVALFRVTWKLPLGLALTTLLVVPFAGATPYHGVANLAAFAVLELMGLAIVLAAIEARQSEQA